MRFFLSVKGDRNYEAGGKPPEALYGTMGQLVSEGFKSGVVTDAGGLKPSSAGALLTARGGRIAVLDGPFAESKEVIGGYCFLELPTKADAIAFATKFIDLHIEAGVPDVDVELREVDTGPDA